jgi:chloramphenicol-sensitive protein RarD
MDETRRGVAAMVAVCVVWGTSPLYYALLSDVPAFEVMCHRAVWSMVLFICVLAARRRLGDLGAVLADRSQRAAIIAASLAISVNWYLFILATAVDRVTESSLGYYLFPLVSVFAGRWVLGERLSPGQWAAVALAAAAVALLGWGLGEMPLLALGLAVTMTIYGLMKRFVRAGPLVSVTAETVWIAPLALAWLLWRGSASHDLLTWVLLAGAGPLTAIPLMMFAFAAKRISMATQGFLMYLNPTLQGLVAALVLLEPVTFWHMVAFPLIWAALAIYSVSSWRAELRARRSAQRAEASGTTVI